jgi:hypothetical protein
MPDFVMLENREILALSRGSFRFGVPYFGFSKN